MPCCTIENGNTERLRATALDGSGAFVTGLSDVLIEIRRESDGFYLDFNDSTFKSTGWTTRQQAMTELNATYSPGAYYYDFNTTGATNTEYFIRVTCASAANFPQESAVTVTAGGALSATQDGWLEDIHVAHFNRRKHDSTANTITIYAADKVTPLHVFDADDNLTDISPQ